jgi:Omp85 superfamily domain
MLACASPCAAQQAAAAETASATEVSAAESAAAASAGAAGAASAAELPRAPPGRLAPATGQFIPVPEIDVDPLSGLTLGVIGVFLHTNDQDQIERIVAPDIIHSQYFGWGSRMRIYKYPSEDTQWSVVGGAKQRVEREFDARYLTGLTRLGELSIAVEAIYDRSGVPRFFGLGNETPQSAETTYVDNQALLNVSVGRNFTPTLQLAYAARWRYVDVLPGVLPGVPSIQTMFPNLLGLGSEHELQQTLTLTRDTRDSNTVPQSGARYSVYGGFVSRALASSVSYTFIGGEVRGYFSFASDYTLAWHAAVRYMPSAADAPFWALSSLGGDRSVLAEREPLRSDGADRYVDHHLFAGGAELRRRIAGLKTFGTRVNLELAPFIDAGKVSGTTDTSLVSRLHTAVGLGVRAVASPFVVGYVDVGYGSGRTAVFSGIDYPF